MRRLLLLVAAVAVLPGCGETDEPATGPVTPATPATESGRAHHFDVRAFARGLNRPTWVGTPPGTREVWVLEQPGRVVRVAGERRTTLLDLRGELSIGAEQGLLGMAFHPDFAVNRSVYLHWTNRGGDTRVAEFEAAADGTLRQSRELLALDQPEENHNGGHLAFGPDGRLYLGLGDGGGAFDPEHNAQDPEALLGKIVATPVEGAPDWRVVLRGLRNPWRFSFDPALGEIWIGDVGQDEIEEVDRVLLEPDEPPKNLGWHAYEGTRRLPGTHDLEGEGDVVWPAATYSHEDGCSITGGHVYAGLELEELSGRYLYGDYCSGTLWSLRAAPGEGAEDVRREQAKVPQLAHIGTDADGELLFASGAGILYRAVPASSG